MRRVVPAFTLIELMVVSVIVLILASTGLVKYYGSLEKARSAEAYATLADIASAESAYYVENDAYTTTWTSLDRYSAAPSSQNFDYSIASVGSGYVQAEAKTGTVDYFMCISGGGKSSGSAPSCP